jgi:hypothetical protein
VLLFLAPVSFRKQERLMPKTKAKFLDTAADSEHRDARPARFSPPSFWPAQLSIKHTAEYLDYSVPYVWQLIKERELETVAEKAGAKRWVIMESIERHRAKRLTQPRA